MNLTGPDVRILQIHPTRFCNLRCLHCYSSSGPRERGELGALLLQQTIRHAAALGYNALSISGGEPLLYSQLDLLCREARSHRMITTLVTNGTVFTRRKLEALEGLLDMLAISIDGAPDRHNRIRGSERAFQEMEERLELVRRAGIPFAFVYTLTKDNLPDLEWAAEFAVAQGALMLQVHPIEEFGRASTDLPGQTLHDEQMSTAWMIVECLREIYRGKLTVRLDALSRYELSMWPEPLSEIVSPLVVEEDGTVVPLRYGFPRNYALGSLHRQDLAQLVAVWNAGRSAEFRALYRQTVQHAREADRMFANLYELLSEEAAGDRLISI